MNNKVFRSLEEPVKSHTKTQRKLLDCRTGLFTKMVKLKDRGEEEEDGLECCWMTE